MRRASCPLWLDGGAQPTHRALRHLQSHEHALLTQQAVALVRKLRLLAAQHAAPGATAHVHVPCVCHAHAVRMHMRCLAQLTACIEYLMHMPRVCLRQALRCRDTAERFRLAERQLCARHQVLRARSAVAVAVG
jgi:hypothetical protein